MQLGVGLPAVVPGATADLLLRWARDADAAEFSTLGVHDRLAWDGFECLGVLNAAAAVTDRIRLASLVLIAPLRPAMLIASQTAAIQRLSQGRLTLGVGIGPRQDDYEAAGAAFGTRGRRLEGTTSANGTSCGAPGSTGRACWSAAAATRPSPGWPATPRATSTAAVPPAPSSPRPTEPWRPGTTPDGRAVLASSGPATSRSVGLSRRKEFLRRYYRFVGPFAERIADGILTSRRRDRRAGRRLRGGGLRRAGALPDGRRDRAAPPVGGDREGGRRLSCRPPSAGLDFRRSLPPPRSWWRSCRPSGRSGCGCRTGRGGRSRCRTGARSGPR